LCAVWRERAGGNGPTFGGKKRKRGSKSNKQSDRLRSAPRPLRGNIPTRASTRFCRHFSLVGWESTTTGEVNLVRKRIYWEGKNFWWVFTSEQRIERVIVDRGDRGGEGFQKLGEYLWGVATAPAYRGWKQLVIVGGRP